MKLAAIGFLLASATTAGTVMSAQAAETTSSGSSVVYVGGSHSGRATLGAPLYAGPNVIVIGGGRTYYGKPLGYGRRGYGGYGYGSRRGLGFGYSYGYRWRGPRYGYNPYRGNPYSYGNRYAYPRYNYVIPPPLWRFGDDRRPYGRERYDHRPRLTILGATYRSIDGRACDAFSFVHRRCDGEVSCSVRSNNNICGDSDRGRLKVLEIVYACGDQQLRANVPERSRSNLRCR